VANDGLSEARETRQHDHILLKSPDKARMRDNLAMGIRLIEQGDHSIGMTSDVFRYLLSHEWTFRIPPQQHLVVRLVPHQRQRI
jgi:hypothetical protein